MTIAMATPRTRIIRTVSSVLNPKLNQSLTCTNLTQPISHKSKPKPKQLRDYFGHSTENWSSKSVQLSFSELPYQSCLAGFLSTLNVILKMDIRPRNVFSSPLPPDGESIKDHPHFPPPFSTNPQTLEYSVKLNH